MSTLEVKSKLNERLVPGVKSCPKTLRNALSTRERPVERFPVTPPVVLSASIAPGVPRPSAKLESAAVLLAENPKPTDKDIDEAMSGNICCCGIYLRICKVIHKAVEMAAEGKAK